MLLCIVIFVHSILKKPQDRRFKFYAPKVLLIGLIWLLSIAFFTWTSLQTLDDPAYDQDTSFPWFRWLEYTWFALLGIYAVQLVFYVVRIFTAFKRFKFRGVTTKFLALTMLTSLVLIFSIVAVVVMIIFEFYTSSSIYVLFRALFNYYTFFFAFCFIPTRKPETDMEAIQKETQAMVEKEEEEH